jgi:NAD(P)-dependent dehydrogenase (short-subunit alcohol dehydrogenase family)
MAQTYLVTGASRGLGAEFVRQLRGRGHDVIAAVRDPAKAADAAAVGARVLTLDVTKPETFDGFAASIGGPVDVLLNNAAIAEGKGSIAEVTVKSFEDVFRANVFGIALLTRAMLPVLRSGRRKVVVNVSSQLGSITNAEVGFSYAYCVSKAAVNMLSRLTHLELRKEGFTAIALDPGWNRTDMGGNDAPLDPKDTVRSMVGLLERLGPEDSGKYLRYDGEPVPW